MSIVIARSRIWPYYLGIFFITVGGVYSLITWGSSLTVLVAFVIGGWVFYDVTRTSESVRINAEYLIRVRGFTRTKIPWLAISRFSVAEQPTGERYVTISYTDNLGTKHHLSLEYLSNDPDELCELLREYHEDFTAATK